MHFTLLSQSRYFVCSYMLELKTFALGLYMISFLGHGCNSYRYKFWYWYKPAAVTSVSRLELINVNELMHFRTRPNYIAYNNELGNRKMNNFVIRHLPKTLAMPFVDGTNMHRYQISQN